MQEEMVVYILVGIGFILASGLVWSLCAMAKLRDATLEEIGGPDE